jgi:hypothetical protein
MAIAGAGLVLYTVGYAWADFWVGKTWGVGHGWNTNSCSFPVIVVVALAYINKKQEHNDTLRMRQFGELYDRWRTSPATGQRLVSGVCRRPTR